MDYKALFKDDKGDDKFDEHAFADILSMIDKHSAMVRADRKKKRKAQHTEPIKSVILCITLPRYDTDDYPSFD